LDAVFDPNVDPNRDLADKVRVDLAQNVDNQYPSTTLFDVTADGNGITSTTDRRRLDPTVSASTVEATESFIDPEGTVITSLSDPVRVTQEASTFSEASIDVQLNNTQIKNGSIQLGFKSGDTVTRPDDNFQISTRQNGIGMQVNPNVSLDGLRVEISSLTGPVQDVFIADSSENILIEKTAGFSSGDVIDLPQPLAANTDFFVGVYNNQNDYNDGLNNSTSAPFTSPDFDVTARAFDCHPDDGQSASTPTGSSFGTFKSIASLNGDALSGDALISFGPPTDIISYDLATFQATADGETVSVDVEDGGGSVLFSDISQNIDISTVSPSTNVKLRANLSRSNTANNPTIDFLARRFIR
jgi:hypothetical protein